MSGWPFKRKTKEDEIKEQKKQIEPIQHLVDLWIARQEKPENPPKTVFLNSRNEFDIFKHKNDIIHFENPTKYDLPFQSLHNCMVLSDYEKKLDPIPCCASEYYFVFPEKQNQCDFDTIDFYVNDLLLDSKSMQSVIAWNSMLDIRPKSAPNEAIFVSNFSQPDMYGFAKIEAFLCNKKTNEKQPIRIQRTEYDNKI